MQSLKPCLQHERLQRESLLLIFVQGACLAVYIHQPCNAAFWPFL